MLCRFKALGVALFILPACSNADVLHLLNGDRLTGTFKSLVSGFARFEYGTFGVVTVPMEQIAAIAVDRDVRVLFADGREVIGQLLIGSDRTTQLRTGEASRPLPWADIVAIDPPVAPLPKWRGSASSNLNFSRSNSDSRVFNVDLELKRRAKSDETTINATYLYGQQTQPSTGSLATTQDSWTFQGQYSRYKTDRFFGFGSVRLDRDGIVDLSLRSIIGGGAGWMVYQRGKTELWVESGVSHLREQFSDSSPTNERLTGQLSYRFKTLLLGRLEVGHDVAFFPTLDNTSDYYLSSRLSVRSSLADNLFANFRFVYDLDSTPAPGSRRDSSKYTFGIGYRF